MANVTHRAGATARVVLLVLLLIALCFGFLLLIPRPRQKQGPRIAGLNALAHLGLEIARWRVEHGVELPETLEEFGSSVVQGFGDTTNLFIYFGRKSPYPGIIAIERFPSPSGRSPHWTDDKIAVLRTDLGATFLPTNALRATKSWNR